MLTIMETPEKLIFHCDQCDEVFETKINLEKHLVCHTSLPRRSRRSVTHPNWARFSKLGYDDSEFDFHTVKKQESGVQRFKNEPSMSDSDQIQPVTVKLEDIKQEENFECQSPLQDKSNLTKAASAASKSSKYTIKTPTTKAPEFHKDLDEQMNEDTVDPKISLMKSGERIDCHASTEKSEHVTCEECQLHFKDQKQLTDHINAAHENSKIPYMSQNEVQTQINADNLANKQNYVNPVNSNSNELFVPNNNLLYIGQPVVFYNIIPIQPEQSSNTFTNLENISNIPLPENNSAGPVNESEQIQHSAADANIPIQPEQSSNSFINLKNISNIPLPENNSAGPVNESEEIQHSAADANIPIQPEQSSNSFTNLRNIFNIPLPENNSAGLVNEIELLYSAAYAPPRSEDIPKFDFDSEVYVKWLRKFVNECRTQTFPLSPALCNKIRDVNDDIFDALVSPTGTLRKKENFRFLWSMYNILTDIMTRQLEFRRSSAKKELHEETEARMK